MNAPRQGGAGTPRRYRVLIVGAGFSGIGMAIRLRQRGEEDFVIYEKEAGFGGTWWVNQYPGCACDIPSHLYSFSFAPNPGWTRRFSAQPEIRDYLIDCAERHGLGAHTRFNTSVKSLRWLEEQSLWEITDERGETVHARVVVTGTGALSMPRAPDIPGIERFRGRIFHSQRWAHDYPLAGKRVGVIGTGASAIQFIPAIQPQVAKLVVFQRTAPWIIPKLDRVFSVAERKLLHAAPWLQKLLRGAIYTAVEARVLGFVFQPRLMALHRFLALTLMRCQVRDRALRRRLTPDYAIGCKRILISNDYYPAIAQPNVELVTSDILEITEDALVTRDQVRHPLDALILGTGFSANSLFPRGMIFGRRGRDLLDAWPQGPEAYKGTTVAGYPNLFLLMGPNTGLGHNSIVYMIESQIAYVLGALDAMAGQGLASVEVRPQAQQRFNDQLHGRMRGTVWSRGQCQSWYLHPQSGRNVALWPGLTWVFRRQTRRFDTDAYCLKPKLAGQHQSHEQPNQACRQEEVV